MIRIKVLGGSGLKRKFRDLERAQRALVQEAVSESLEEVRGEARQALEDGPVPKSQTGRLADSLFVRVDPDGLGGEVGTDLDYGRHLEFGTRAMPAHPWLQPAFERLKPRIRERIAEAVRRAARGGDAGGASDPGTEV